MGISHLSIRKIKYLVEGVPTSDGAGVNLTRIIGSPELNMLDPFLLLDEFGSDNPDDYIAGFPPHPHRGFETITYMINGKFTHKDSAGNEGHLNAGGVQWMTAGKGVVHSEMPEQTEGLMRGFQLWLNLPKEKKMFGFPVTQSYRYLGVELEDDGTFQIEKCLRNEKRKKMKRLNWIMNGKCMNEETRYQVW